MAVDDPDALHSDPGEPLERWKLIARTRDSANNGLPALFTPTPSATERFLEFFTAQINNDHTRRAYANATRRFATWCTAHGIAELNDVRPIHVATFIKELEGKLSPPTVKQNLAALRTLFDWLVTGHVLDANPAHAVRGPKYVVHKGKTPVLNGDEARTLIDSIDTSTFVGLRDRALIGTMVYTFARVGAVLEMKVKDYFVQGRRGWVRLHEKGGKEHEVPCHHNLESYLDAYIAAADIAEDAEAPLFRTTGRKLGQWTAMTQQDAFRMIQRRRRAAGLATRVNNHTFRATGITAYMKNGGTLEHAQQLANHSSPRTTKLYDRRQDEISLDEVEKIVI
jgi:site-specific recombinase XerD